MILGKYLDENGIDVLKNLRLKVKDPLKFNDPFESSPYVEGKIRSADLKHYIRRSENIDIWYPKFKDRVGVKNKREFKRLVRSWNEKTVLERVGPNFSSNIRKNLEAETKKFSEICRILCFSNPKEINPHEDILMWSHYAESHLGIKIFFDMTKMKLRSNGPDKVLYRKNRVQLDLSKIFRMDKEVFKEFGRSVIIKSDVWAYEHEYRWLIDKIDWFTENINNNNYDFIKISPDAIMRVDIGVNSNYEFKNNLMTILKIEHFNHVDIRIAKLDEKMFQLNYEKYS